MNVVCIASGESLRLDDVLYVRGKARAMVVNDNYRIAPWADWMYAADYDWWASVAHWQTKPNHVLSAEMFHGERWTCDEQAAKHFGLKFIEHVIDPEIGKVWGCHSGIQAVLLAQILGAQTIYLLGYDLSGDSHWFGSHPTLKKFNPITKETTVESLERTKAANFPMWREEFTKIRGVNIVNCTRQSALDCFPRKTITEVL